MNTDVKISDQNVPETAAVPESAGESAASKKEFKKMFFKFAGMSTSFWFSFCFCSYLTIFLQSIGWDSARVGIINSLNSAVGVFSTPFWGTISDKLRSIKKILIILIIASAVSYFLIPFMDISVLGISLLFIVIPFSNFFRMPLSSLIDNWTVRACNKHGMNFGAIRSTGSISFGIIGITLGFVITRINNVTNSNLGTRLTFPMFAVTIFVLLAVVASIKDDLNGGSSKRLRFRDMHFSELFKNYYYMTYLVYAMVIQVPLACVYAFLPYLLSEVNVDSATIGYITGFKAFIEVPMLLLMDRVRNKVPLYYLLFASGALYMGEALGYSLCTGFWGVLAISTLQGLAGGLHIAAGSNYVATLAPENLKATAQTLNGSMVSLAGIIGNLAGGFIIRALGIRIFYRLAAILILVGLAFYIGSFPFGERVLHLPKPKIQKHGIGISH